MDYDTSLGCSDLFNDLAELPNFNFSDSSTTCHRPFFGSGTPKNSLCSIFIFRTLWLRLTGFGAAAKSIMTHISRLTSNSPISTHTNGSKKTKERRLEALWRYTTVVNVSKCRKLHVSNFVLELLRPFSTPRKSTRMPCRRLERTVEMTRFTFAQWRRNQWCGPYENNLYHKYRYCYYRFTMRHVNAICPGTTFALRRGLNNRISVGGARRYCRCPRPRYNPSVGTTAFRTDIKRLIIIYYIDIARCRVPRGVAA